MLIVCVNASIGNQKRRDEKLKYNTMSKLMLQEILDAATYALSQVRSMKDSFVSMLLLSFI